ncbi:MAG: prephenate dehydrogenase [Oscillospiraceae bacterium]|jgi:prephenate dehydrogenase|nr:prephenate dehydrogenase [Oscillospiraceae bacterium]
MNIAIAGLGLIGGSFAKAIASKTRHRAIGYDRDPEVMRRAYDAGLLDEVGVERFTDADVSLIALYPGASVRFMRENIDAFKRGSIVIDLCGVKRRVTDDVTELFKPRGVTYIGGHPMAGRELSGFAASIPTLFEGASMILTPGADIDPDTLKTAENLFLALGFAKITLTTPDHHDKMIAFTSQLAHIVSSAYAQNPVVGEFDGFAAGSFADMTRVAKLNEHMWTELFLLNADYLSAQLDVLIGSLARFREYITQGKETELRELLRRGREIKESLNENYKPPAV